MAQDKTFGFLFLSLLGWFPLAAAGQQLNKIDISLNTGYQSENFGWSIAGNLNGQNPNIYSELKWDHLQEIKYSSYLTYRIAHNFYFLGGYDHDFILSGEVSDIDYGSDNRTMPINQGKFQDNRGYSDQAFIGVGMTILKNTKSQIALESGYISTHQSLYILGIGDQYPDLNTTYFTTWKGIFLTEIIEYIISKKFRLEEKVSYNQLNYQAKANWNLITQFAHPISYRDNASGYNLLLRPAIIYQLSKQLAINLSGAISHSQTGTGADRLYVANGTVEETQFNRAKGNTVQLTTGLALGF